MGVCCTCPDPAVAVEPGRGSWSDASTSRRSHADRSAFAGFRFPPEVITAIRWYLRHGLSYRDVEELLAEPAEVDHVDPVLSDAGITVLRIPPAVRGRTPTPSGSGAPSAPS
jgi:hypothetical protein